MLVVLHDETIRTAESAEVRTIVDRAHHAIVSVDPDQRIRLFNPAAERVFRMPASQALGQPLGRFLPAAHRDAHRDQIADVLAGRRPPGPMGGPGPGPEILHGLRADDSPFELIAFLSRTGTEDDPRVTIMLRDVTTEQLALRALRAREAHFREIAGHVPDVLWLFDIESWRFVYISPGFESLWGMPTAEVLRDAARLFDLVPATERDRVEEILEGRHAGRSVELRVGGPSDPPRWAEVRTYRVEDASGKRRIAGITRDVTAERAARDRLHLLERSIRHLDDAILVTDADVHGAEGPRILFVNEAFERMTGYSAAEVVGASPKILQGPGTRRSELDRIREALRAEEQVTVELLNYCKGGRPYWVEIALAPIFDEQGHCSNFVSVQRDVSARRESDAKTAEAQRLEALGQMTGGVAHDFNNLLTVILGGSEELLEASEDPVAVREAAEMIAGAARSAADLTQRLLAFSRRQALQAGPVELDGVLRDLEPMLRRMLGERHTVSVLLEAEAPRTFIDVSQFQNAIVNLVLNARDAMEEGGRITIRVGFTYLDDEEAEDRDVRSGEYVTLSVSDTGTGIDPINLARIFEPFFTTKDIGRGTGLGLPMVFGFMKQSGGAVSVDSTLGRGTTVTLYLPKGDGAGADGAAEGTTPEVVGKGRTILLVEDDLMVRQFARIQLGRLGFRVREAADGTQALLGFDQDGPPHLLFTDVMLPGALSGQDIADEARRRWPGLPVVYASGYTQAELAYRCHMQSHELVLQKPYRRSDLAHALRAALGA
ncbi:MAG: PAS domain S-box protein [Pseudomonadales bacterium]|nr:PAS domain S-box protein [Pseudomonadales bacterium]